MNALAPLGHRRSILLNHLVVSLLSATALSLGMAADVNLPAIIPVPAEFARHEGLFPIKTDTVILTDTASHASGEYLAERLHAAMGHKLEVRVTRARKPAKGGILLTTRAAKAALSGEGYEVTVTPDTVIIRAPERAGVFYGVQTLLQMLPPQVFATDTANEVAWSIPCVQIEDRPRFQWRGMMLDVGRHYFSVADIKQMIDVMALHKLNTFHWHLTEDQGWRIEIKKYPKLTEVGAWRASTPPYGNRNSDDGRRYGGFYTQAEVRDIVRYAAARHITVVPEIEMPGHAAAAIAAYPEFGNTDVPDYAPRVMTRWGVHPYIFAPREETFQFLEDVLTEVCDLFPSRFIHIGGDEAPKGQWKESPYAQEVMRREGLKDEHELQSWFIRRIESFLAVKGRRLIGWDEIQEGGLSETATMMVWRDARWAKHALALGNDVVMATTSHTYLDYYQADPKKELAKGVEFEAIGGYLPLEKVYSYNPMFVAESPVQEKQILGTQCQLWSEYLKDIRKVQYMALPRLSALAEVAWSPMTSRDYDDFLHRLETQYERFNQIGLNYRRETAIKIGEWTPGQITTQGVTLEYDVTRRVAAAGHLSVSLSYTRGAHGIRIESVRLLEDGREVAADRHDGFAGGNPRRPVYLLELQSYKPGARYTVEARVAGDGGTDSRGVLTLESIPIKSSAAAGGRETTVDSCAQPSPEDMAGSAGVTLPPYPWHVANIWWDFEKPTEDFILLEVDVTIDRDVSTDFNLYIAPCGIARIDGLDFYGGLQSNINGWGSATNRTRLHPGKGAIFSRWSRDKQMPVGLENVRVAGRDCLIESAGYEGEFASVRRPFAWTKGTYTYRIEKGESEVVDGKTNTWFLCSVKDSNGQVHDIGSLRFEGADFTFWARHSAFVEVYSTSRIPRSYIPKVNITFSWPRLNNRKPALKRAHAYYPSSTGPAAPDCAWIRADGEQVVVEVGPVFLRDEKMRRHDLPIKPATVSGKGADKFPNT